MTAKLSRLVYGFNDISITFPEGFSCIIEKLTLKFTWKSKESRTAKMILKKKNKVRGLWNQTDLDLNPSSAVTSYVTLG